MCVRGGGGGGGGGEDGRRGGEGAGVGVLQICPGSGFHQHFI